MIKEKMAFLIQKNNKKPQGITLGQQD